MVGEKCLSVGTPGPKILYDGPISILENNIKVTRTVVGARMTQNRV